MMPVVCVVSAVQIWNYVGQGVLYAIKIIEFTPAIIRLCHGPPSWITSLNIVHEVEATRGKFTNKMATSSDSVELEFWHKNITKIPKVTNSFVEDFAEKNLPIKATVTRGYKFFHEEYIHDIEGEPR